MWIDSHCHINFPKLFPQAERIIFQAKEQGFFAVIDCGVNLETSLKSSEISSKYKLVYSIIGFHPSYAEEFSPEVIKEYQRLIKENRKIVGIGEIGLDNKTKVPIGIQKKVFLEMAGFAQEQNLPVIIHNRGYEEEVLQILSGFKLRNVLMHCFSQNSEFAKKVLDKGYFLSFAGNITYPKAENIREAAKYAPLGQILTETDSPYLAPQIVRGKTNTPLYVKEIYETISREKNIPLQKVKSQVKRNFCRIFPEYTAG